MSREEIQNRRSDASLSCNDKRLRASRLGARGGADTMEMVHDDGGEGEENEVVKAEGDFIPRGPWAGDELGEDVLGDQDEPDDNY